MTDEKHGPSRTLDVLNARGLASKREYVRGLELRTDAESLSLLVECLCDDSWYLRDLAEEAFLKLGERGAEALIPLLERGVWFTRASAARVLGKLGHRPAVPALLRLTQDQNDSVANAARDALVGIGNQQGGIRLAHALHCMPPDVRRLRMDEIAARDRGLGERIDRMMHSEELMSAEGVEALTDESAAVRASEEGVEWEILTGPPPPTRVRASRAADMPDPDRPQVLGAPRRRSLDPEYPAGLEALADPPQVVYVRGGVPHWTRCVAVVGSRAATPYGLERAHRLAADLARLGYTIVSGLARGIDAAAHRGALDSGGTTVAVLPGALDAVSPRYHQELAEAAAARGALLSEVAPGAPLRGGMFVKRNRLIAALAAATVVVEAAERSGALSTAGFARRLGRPLLAVPGDVDRPTSRGCHALIRGGAALCEGPGDVIAALVVDPRVAPLRGPTRGLDLERSDGPCAPPASAESALLAALSERPCTPDVLARNARVSLEEALPALLQLEWAGLARAHPGQRWALARKPGS